MGIKSFYILIILLTCTACNNTDYQVLEVNNKTGVLEVLNSNYVIDSVAFEKDDRIVFSIALKNKISGSNKLNLLNPSNNYNIYLDSIDFKDCNTSGGFAFIRQKGFTKKITYSVENQKKHYQEIQQFWFNYQPCQDSIMKIDALRRYK